MTITIIQKLWKENSKKENYFESVCGHRAEKGRHQEFVFIMKVLVIVWCSEISDCVLSL
jgi:hypothetical protein